METINVTIGYRTINNGDVKYYGGETDNGICYKDLNAWECNEGIIYIGEYELEDVNNFSNCIKECWTKQSWIEFVKGVIAHHFYEEIEKLSLKEKNLLINFIAYNSLCECDWQDLSTFLEDWDWEDCIDEIIEDIRDNYVKYENI